MSTLKNFTVLSNNVITCIIGENEKNLEIISKEFNVNISSKGNDIFISGNKEDVDNAYIVLKQLEAVCDGSSVLSSVDIDCVLKAVSANKMTDYARMKNTIIATDFKGKPIKPRTFNQLALYDSVTDNDITFGYGPSGCGKAQPAYSKIRTPNGWTTMGDIKVGDTVMCPDNTTATVVNKYFNSTRQLYKLTFEDGRSTIASDNHLWDITSERKSIGVNYRTMSTVDIIDRMNTLKCDNYIQLPNPIECYVNEDLPIHPYIMGVLIGDGSFGHGLVITSADEELITTVNELLIEDHVMKPLPNTKINFRINNEKNRHNNYYIEKIKQLGLYGKKSYEKFIPEEYLNTSIENRLLLLQGLLDTDGSVCKHNSIEYSTTSKILAKQVVELFRSLGCTCRMSSRMGSYKDKHGNMKQTRINYRIKPGKISTDIKLNLFKLKRKLERLTPGQYDGCKNIKIVKIEKHSVENCWCIEIDSPKHLYITDDYIVTHNTLLAVAMGVKALLDKKVEKLILTRPAVEAGERLGYLPGNESEKLEPYLRPLYNYLDFIVGKEKTNMLLLTDKIEIHSVGFMRGADYKHSFVIVDEAQNTRPDQMKMILTRLSTGSKMVITGDVTQTDLYEKNHNGLTEVKQILRGVDGLGFVFLDESDIIRHPLVKKIVKAYDTYYEQQRETRKVIQALQG